MSKDFKIHSVKYNLIMNVILKMSSFIFPLITFPYVSRILGAVGNGKVSFATSVIYYFTVIATLGIPTYGVKICAQYRDDKKKLSKTVKELLIISNIMMIISYLIFFIALFLIPKLYEEKILMLINSVTIILTVLGVEWFYQAIEQYDYITFRNLAFKVLSIVLMFLFVHKSEDYIMYGAITVVGTTGSNILNIIRINKYVNLKESCEIELYKHIRPIFTLFMLTAATMIYTSLDSVMLGFISGDEQVGYYNAATKLKSILVSFVTALGVVLLPRLSNCLSNNDYFQFNILIKKSFNFVLITSLPLTVYSILEAENCINFLAGSGYHQAILSMQYISPSIIFIGLSNIIGIQILIPTGKENLTVLSTVIGAVVNLILNTLLIYYFAASGAALATTIAELSVLLVQIWVIRKKITNFIEYNNILKIIISLMISSLCLILCIHVICIESLFFTLLLTATIFFGIYCCMLFLLKETIITTTFVNIENKLKKIKR